MLPANTHSLYLNIGSHLNPVKPPANESIAVIAFEPILHAKLVPQERLFVVPAAVAGHCGLAMMQPYAKATGSASLSAPAKSSKWNQDKLPPVVVPVISFSQVLHSVGSRPVWFLKTDMQGHDFSAISSVPCDVLRSKVHYLMSEVYYGGVNTYANISNDYCADLLPHLLGCDYEPIALEPTRIGAFHNLHGGGEAAARRFCAQPQARGHPASNMGRSAGMRETNAYFRLRGSSLPPPTTNDWQQMEAQRDAKGRPWPVAQSSPSAPSASPSRTTP